MKTTMETSAESFFRWTCTLYFTAFRALAVRRIGQTKLLPFSRENRDQIRKISVLVTQKNDQHMLQTSLLTLNETAKQFRITAVFSYTILRSHHDIIIWIYCYHHISSIAFSRILHFGYLQSLLLLLFFIFFIFFIIIIPSWSALKIPDVEFSFLHAIIFRHSLLIISLPSQPLLIPSHWIPVDHLSQFNDLSFSIL